jgi:hypothetical protein
MKDVAPLIVLVICLVYQSCGKHYQPAEENTATTSLNNSMMVHLHRR